MYDFSTLRTLSDVQRNNMASIFGVENSAYFKLPNINFPTAYFLHVFTLSFWLGIVFVVFWTALFIVVYIIVFNQNQSSIITLLMQFFSLVSMEDNKNYNKKLSFKIAITVISIFVFFIASSFSVFLFSQLSSFKFDLPFDTMNEMLQQNEYAMCSRPLSRTTLTFQKIQNNYKIQINPKKCLVDRMDVVNSVDAFHYLHDTICKEKLIYISGIEIMDRIYANEYNQNLSD